MSSLPAFPSRISYAAADRLALAAVLGSRVLKSDAPLSRARVIAGNMAEEVRRDFLLRLAFLQIVAGREIRPEEFGSELRDVRDWVSPEKRLVRRKTTGSAPLVDLDTAMLAVLLRSYGVVRPDAMPDIVDTRRRLRDVFVDPYVFSTFRYSRAFRRADVSPAEVAEAYSTLITLVYKREYDERDRGHLGQILDRFAPMSDVRNGEWVTVSEGRRGYHLDDEVLPIGAWPEIALIVASVRLYGREGITDTLRWVTAAKMSYGVAWRVMLDWRHLEVLVGLPAFDNVIAEEDGLIAEMEERFESGEFAL